MNRRQLLDADWDRLCSFSAEPPKPRQFWSAFNFRFAPVWLIRTAHALHVAKLGPLAKLLSLLNFWIFGIECPVRLAMGPGLVIFHPHGIVIGAGSIGSNLSIYQQVTLGAVTPDFEYDPDKRPRIENNVSLTAGAKIIGPVCIGEGAIVGANAVVLQDVPPGSLAVGVPARIIDRDPADEGSLQTP